VWDRDVSSDEDGDGVGMLWILGCWCDEDGV